MIAILLSTFEQALLSKCVGMVIFEYISYQQNDLLIMGALNFKVRMMSATDMHFDHITLQVAGFS